MGILQLPVVLPAQVGIVPANKRMVTTDNLATITAAAYLNQYDLQSNPIAATDILDVIYSFNAQTNAGTFGIFTVSIANGVITLVQWTNPNDVVLPTVVGDLASFSTTTGTLTDSAVAVTSLVLNANNSGQTISAASTSATPGTIRALTGAMSDSNATVTSGNLVGLRGSVTYVSASGGFFYGVQGKLLPSGTLSGSSWNAGVFGQLDISAATVNAGQTACIWGDYGATSGTITNATGMRGIAMTNTTAAVLNAQDYRYGNATYLTELAGAGGTLNYYIAAGTSAGSAGDAAHCAAQQVLRIEVNGVAAYIPVFTQNT